MRFKRLLGKLVVAAMTVTATSFAAAYAVPVVVANAASVTITEQSGWNESAYVKWSPVSGASGYRAYIKKDGGSYTQLDDPLIRSYGSYWRADAVGLAKGNYTMRVEAVDSSGKTIAYDEVSGLSVSSYDRSGSAFSSNSTYKTGSGAYNDNGTLLSTAQVVYVTPSTAKTVKADIISDAKGTKTTYTGFQNIIYGLQKGYDTRGLDIRIIGCIDAGDMDAFGSSAEGLQVKGKAAYSRMNLTIEGIGEDACIKNFGILIRNAGNVEIRNFGIMLCMDDALSLDTANCNVWVHNMDCFYGNTGGDADQAKGDGTMDVKGKSTYVTFSYNHFWDNGKSSLCGMKSETTDCFITYHHNWFDHSDSRHPRIRTMSVHVYNNYFDSCAKYGVGMTSGGSAFVENNYFLDTTRPMMISGQGTDASGAGTFSGENGGVIKAYNNKFTFNNIDASKLQYKTQNDSSTQFDAIEVSSRNAKVGSEYKAAKGGTAYNNFDTSWDLAVNVLDSTDSVPSKVKAAAGRMNGGDFPKNRNSYSILNDASSYAVDSSLKNAMGSYKSSLVSVGGGAGKATVVTEKTTEATTKAAVTTTKKTETTTKETETTTKKTETTTKKVETTTEATTQAPVSDPSAGSVDMGTYKLNSSTVSGKSSTYAGMVFNVRSVESDCVKLRSDNSITFTVDVPCTLTAVVSGKGIVVNGTTTGTGSVSVSLSAGTYTIKGATSGSNSAISSLTFEKASSVKTTKETTTESTTKETTTKTTTTKETTTKTTTTKTTTTKETITETTTKSSGSTSGGGSSSSSSKSIKFEKSSVNVKPGESATIKINASGAYYIEQENASWWFESDWLYLWGSNANKKLTNSSLKFTINQWAGVKSGHVVTLTAHLVDDPSVVARMLVVVKY